MRDLHVEDEYLLRSYDDRLGAGELGKIFRVDRVDTTESADHLDEVLGRNESALDMRDRPVLYVGCRPQRFFEQAQIVGFRFDWHPELPVPGLFDILPKIIPAAQPFFTP